MSSRALRKLQREEEERRQLESAKIEPQDADSSEEEAPKSKALNAFDMLNENDENEIEDEEMHSEQMDSEVDTHAVAASQSEQTQSPQTQSRKTKKKKGKKKGKGVERIGAPREQNDGSELDEIDQALKSLSTQNPQATTPASATVDEANEQLHRLLAVEAKHLNALNEMKRLFGNVVMENEEGGQAAPRRRGRGPQQVDLGGALAARNSPVSRGQGLKGLALKRNPLMMGKEEWPQATSGGLGMELVEKMEDGTVEYRFVHNTIYQDVQRQFESCVASMDPQRMISMLQFNPYHVSTLLQVSEIAKQQGDHSVSGDLLERALFTFGRSVHSSFTNALSEGKARLDFRRPENREFFLAAWRFTKDLGQRGTWRTAYEWAKLILSLDPEGDPYCISKWLDQLALRGGQPEHYLDLSHQSLFSEGSWRSMPNTHISSSLAQYRLKQAQKCRSTLTKAVSEYPWIFTRLFQELNISHTPKSIWGCIPRTDREKFDMETYILNAKDLWSTPEAIALLVEVVESAPSNNPPPANDTAISLDEARNAILLGNTTLINLIPREYTNLPTTSSDPLPPPDNLSSYDPSLPQAFSHRDPELDAAYADLSDNSDQDVAAPQQETASMTGFFERLMGRFIRARTAEPALPSSEGATQAAAEDQEQLGPHDLTVNDREFVRLLREANQEAERRAADGGNEGEGSESQARLMELVHAAERNTRQLQEAQSRLSEQQNRERFETARSGTSSSPGTSPSRQAQTDDDNVPADDTLQRYLAGSGLMQLRAHADKYPNQTTTEKWESNPEGTRLLDEYSDKLQQLRNRRTGEFILKYALPQGAGAEVKELVERRVRESR